MNRDILLPNFVKTNKSHNHHSTSRMSRLNNVHQLELGPIKTRRNRWRMQENQIWFVGPTRIYHLYPSPKQSNNIINVNKRWFYLYQNESFRQFSMYLCNIILHTRNVQRFNVLNSNWLCTTWFLVTQLSFYIYATHNALTCRKIML